MKKRDSRNEDQAEVEAAYRLILSLVREHEEFDYNVWAGACWSALVNCYLSSGVNHKFFCKELDMIKIFYKDHFKNRDDDERNIE